MSMRVETEDEILSVLKKYGSLKPKEISELTGLNHNTVRGCLQRMLKKGLVERVKRGVYKAA